MMSMKQKIWLAVRAGFLLAFAYVIGGLRMVLVFVFGFMFYAIGNQYSYRRDAERMAENEQKRATDFQLFALRRHARLLWYRRACWKRLAILNHIIATQDSIAQIKTQGGKIKSLVIDGVLFVPRSMNENRQTSRDDDSFFDNNQTIG